MALNPIGAAKLPLLEPRTWLALRLGTAECGLVARVHLTTDPISSSACTVMIMQIYDQQWPAYLRKPGDKIVVSPNDLYLLSKEALAKFELPETRSTPTNNNNKPRVLDEN